MTRDFTLYFDLTKEELCFLLNGAGWSLPYAAGRYLLQDHKTGTRIGQIFDIGGRVSFRWKKLKEYWPPREPTQFRLSL